MPTPHQGSFDPRGSNSGRLGTRAIRTQATQELTVLNTLLWVQPAGTSTRQQRFCIGQGGWRAPRRANMSEGSKERSPQQLAKSRRDYLAQVRMLPVDERTHEAAEINKALGIKEPKGTAAAATLDAARAAYIRMLGSLGSNAEVKAEVTCF